MALPSEGGWGGGGGSWLFFCMVVVSFGCFGGDGTAAVWNLYLYGSGSSSSMGLCRDGGAETPEPVQQNDGVFRIVVKAAT